jgi:hypothetical protein
LERAGRTVRGGESGGHVQVWTGWDSSSRIDRVLKSMEASSRWADAERQVVIDHLLG